MVTDEQIEAAFKGTNFGPMKEPAKERREILARAIFKRLANYYPEWTLECILTELGMTTKQGGMPVKKARRWAYEQYHQTRAI